MCSSHPVWLQTPCCAVGVAKALSQKRLNMNPASPGLCADVSVSQTRVMTLKKVNHLWKTGTV